MKITVRSALSSLVLGGIVATSIASAFADDELKIVDVNYPTVVVQYKVSGDDSIGDATSGETKTLKKGETWAIPVAGERVFWHREANPGSGDGQWTAWVLVRTDAGSPPTQTI
jgi:hypothetical protein